MNQIQEGISFYDALDKRLLFGDGAMGTMLQKMGITQSPDILNTDEQKIEKVVEVHLGYLKAGSDMVQTNTFGSNPIKLESSGKGHALQAVNRNAVSAVKKAIKLYREATNSKRRIFIAGSVGPLGKLLKPSGMVTYRQAVEAFGSQIKILAGAGIDALIIETMMDINEAYAAIQAAKQATDLPIICTLTFGSNGVTLMGNKAEEAVTLLQDKGADVVGANCSLGSEGMLDIARKMREADQDAKLIFQPNAGLPVVKDGETSYDESPQVIAENISQYLAYQPSIIGTCCGSTPMHIKHIIDTVS